VARSRFFLEFDARRYVMGRREHWNAALRQGPGSGRHSSHTGPLRREAPTGVNAGEIAVSSNEELHSAPLSGKRLLALWNALPGVEKRRKVAAVSSIGLRLGSSDAGERASPPNSASGRSLMMTVFSSTTTFSTSARMTFARSLAGRPSIFRTRSLVHWKCQTGRASLPDWLACRPGC